MNTRADWERLAASLTFRTKAFVDGQYIDAASGETFQIVNPASGTSIAQIASCGNADVERAVKAARRAFDSGVWSRMDASQRGRRLQKFADLIDANLQELALLETLDAGKPIADSLAVDIPLSANAIRWYGQAIDKIYDEVAPTSRNAIAMIRREPVGVVAAVVPWNFPLLMAAWKIGPVLAAGNSIILKPAEQSPLTAIRIAELAAEADIPAGVFNVLPGFGETAGQALGRHPDVDAITFTGSTEVGKYFLKYAAESNMKRVSLECGGKSPNIIFADAPNLDQAAVSAAWGIFYNQGEVCNAGSRLLVQRSIKDEFVAKVIEVAKSIKMGDTLEPTTQMGPVVDDRQMSRVLGYIDHGLSEGAKLRCGGVRRGDMGFFVEPTIFDDVVNSMTIAQQEIFGPVLSVIAFDDDEEAVKIANDTQYGLAAALWSSDINRIHRVSDRLRAGVVWVNCFDKGEMSTPFGGMKQSGFGRDKSLHAIDKYTDLKTTWIHVDR